MKFEIIALFSISFLLLLLLRSVQAQEVSAATDQEAISESDYEEGGDGEESAFEKATSNILAEVVNDRIKNFTSVFKDDIQENFGFCIADASVPSLSFFS